MGKGKRQAKEEKKEETNQKWKTNMRSRRRPSPEGTRSLFAGRTVSPTMCPADRRQKDDKKRPAGRQARTRVETKPKKTKADRNEVVGFRWTCVCLVCRGDPAWSRMIYRDISWYVIPYHAISQDTWYQVRHIEIQQTVSYPYPETLGLVSRFRIPSKYLSIFYFHLWSSLSLCCSWHFSGYLL